MKMKKTRLALKCIYAVIEFGLVLILYCWSCWSQFIPSFLSAFWRWVFCLFLDRIEQFLEGIILLLDLLHELSDHLVLYGIVVHGFLAALHRFQMEALKKG